MMINSTTLDVFARQTEFLPKHDPKTVNLVRMKGYLLVLGKLGS